MGMHKLVAFVLICAGLLVSACTGNTATSPTPSPPPPTGSSSLAVHLQGQVAGQTVTPTNGYVALSTLSSQIDGTGTARFSNLAANPYTLSINAFGFGPMSKQVTLGNGGMDVSYMLDQPVNQVQYLGIRTSNGPIKEGDTVNYPVDLSLDFLIMNTGGAQYVYAALGTVAHAQNGTGFPPAVTPGATLPVGLSQMTATAIGFRPCDRDGLQTCYPSTDQINIVYAGSGVANSRVMVGINWKPQS